MSYKISLVVVCRQEEGLSNSLDNLHIRITSTQGYSEIAKAARRFQTEYNEDPSNRGKIFDWYIAEEDDLLGLTSLDLAEESEDD